MGLEIYIYSPNDEELFYSRKEYGLWGWFIDFAEANEYGKTDLTKEHIEDLVIACESCLRNPLLVPKLFLPPHPDRSVMSFYSSRDLQRYFIPLRREMKNILKNWQEGTYLRISG